MLVLFLVFVLLFIFVVTKYMWNQRELYRLSAKLPGPTGLPILGCALKLLCKQDDLFSNFVELIDPYTSPCKIWLGPKLMIVVKDPEKLQMILQSSKITKKAFFYRFLEFFLGMGLVTAADPVHKNHKKILQPLFHQKIIDGYSHLFQKHAHKLVENLEQFCDGKKFNIIYTIHDSIFESTMDVMLEDKNNHVSLNYKDVPRYIQRFTFISFKRLKRFWLHFDFIFEKTRMHKKLLEMKQTVESVIDEIMNSTVRKVLQRLSSGNFTDEETRTPSILEMITEMIIDSPKTLSFQNCSDHILTFIGASQDTTCSTIGFTCLMLAAYPKIQDLVYKELKDVLGNKTAIDSIDVSKLKYLEMCLKETMRLFPSVPFIFRDTTEKIQLGDFIIPKNVTVALSIYHAHRNAKYWERPNDFYPEHFTDEAIKKRHPCAFIPFSLGPRKCIAQYYSYVNIKIYLTTILLNYQLETEKKLEDIKLASEITIRPIGGYFLKIKKRL